MRNESVCVGMFSHTNIFRIFDSKNWLRHHEPAFSRHSLFFSSNILRIFAIHYNKFTTRNKMEKTVDNSLKACLVSVLFILYALQYDNRGAFYFSVLFTIISMIQLAKSVSIFRKSEAESRRNCFNTCVNRFTASVFLIGVYISYVIEFIKNI